MKTAISLPDRLFEEAETLAKRLGKSRSQLYAEALAAYVGSHDAGEITARLDHVLRQVGSATSREDRAVTATSEAVLRQVEW